MGTPPHVSWISVSATPDAAPSRRFLNVKTKRVCWLYIISPSFAAVIELTANDSGAPPMTGRPLPFDANDRLIGPAVSSARP